MNAALHKFLNTKTKLAVAIVAALTLIWLLASWIFLLISPGIILKPERSYSLTRPLDQVTQFLRTENDKNLEMWYYQNPASENLVIYLHGNSGPLVNLYDIYSQNFNILTPFMPGFGNSEGAATTENWYAASLDVYQYATEQLGFPEENITIFGHSLGGSTSTYLASQKSKAKQLILINAISSVQNMCWDKYYIFCVFAGNLFNSAENAKQVTIPVLHFHYTKDTTVPFKYGQNLHKYFTKTENKQFIEITGYNHSYVNATEIQPYLE